MDMRKDRRRDIDRALREVFGDSCRVFSVEDGGVTLQISAEELLRLGTALRRRVRLRGLGIHSATRSQLARLSRSPSIDGLEHVGVYRPTPDVRLEDLAVFVRALRGVRSLELPSVGEVGAAAAASNPDLWKLSIGSVSPWAGEPIGSRGLAHIAGMSGLTGLTLWDQQIGAKGWRALNGCGLTDLTVAKDVLGEAPDLPSLRVLKLLHVEADGLSQWLSPRLLSLCANRAFADRHAIAAALRGGSLRTLRLMNGAVDVPLLVNLELPELETLDLGPAYPTEIDLEPMVFALLKPHSLGLMHVGSPGEGERRALASPFGERLSELALCGFKGSGWVDVALARPLRSLEIDEADYHPADLDRFLAHGGATLVDLDLDRAFGCTHDRVLAWAAHAPQLQLQTVEATAPKRQDLLAFAANPAVRGVEAVTLNRAGEFDDLLAEVWTASRHLSPELELSVRGSEVSDAVWAKLRQRFAFVERRRSPR